jgi:HSP20 family protein
MTTLVKWAPFRELDLMERNMRRMFGLNLAPVLPAADIYETKEEFVFELEVPGFEEEELAIEVSDHVLTVKGEHKEKKTEAEKAFHLHERIERQFERQFELPPTIEAEKLTATFKKGVLELHAPKSAEVLPRKVPISLN